MDGGQKYILVRTIHYYSLMNNVRYGVAVTIYMFLKRICPFQVVFNKRKCWKLGLDRNWNKDKRNDQVTNARELASERASDTEVVRERV